MTPIPSTFPTISVEINDGFTPHLLGREIVNGSLIHVVNAYGDKSCSVILCIGPQLFVEFEGGGEVDTYTLHDLLKYDFIHWDDECEEARKELE
jgi:hypothetical protein